MTDLDPARYREDLAMQLARKIMDEKSYSTTSLAALIRTTFADALEDKVRMDWLVPLVDLDSSHMHRDVYYYQLRIRVPRVEGMSMPSLRAAIDSARKQDGNH